MDAASDRAALLEGPASCDTAEVDTSPQQAMDATRIAHLLYVVGSCCLGGGLMALGVLCCAAPASGAAYVHETRTRP